MKLTHILRSTLALSALAVLSACGSGRDLTITKIKPPTKEAAGTGLTANASRLYSSKSDVGALALDATAVRTAFFAGSGPTDVMTILGALDRRLTEIEESASAGETPADCLDATPSSVTISVVGESVTAKFQCYKDIDSGFIAFGKDGDTWWVLDATGAANTLAKATESGNGTDVEIWGTVGLTNTTWDGMSYGAYHIKGNSSTRVFEMTTGGIGFGYCGISLNSDGTNLYIRGSADGANGACATNDTACVLSNNLSGTGSCGGSVATPALTQIGRATASGTSRTWAASNWPTSGTLLTMNGTSSDAIHWASKSAITAAGVAQF